MWLTGRLAPDFKTIADFRKDNGKAIRSVCRQFVVLCRNLNLFSQSIIAIDGSKFKAVNNRDRNFTQGKVKARMQQIEQSIDRYLAAMDSADRARPEVAEAKAERLKEKIETLKKQMQKLKGIEAQLHDSPDQQISLTDPDARSMATSGRGTGTVGYNVQTAVDDKHHLIIAHEVTNVGNDRGQLSNMANQAREEIEAESLTVVADRGYYKGLEILACEQAGLHLSYCVGRISMPCGAVTDQAAFVDGRRHVIALLLLLGLPVLRNAQAMYDRQGAPGKALGT
jgi:RNase P protein component